MIHFRNILISTFFGRATFLACAVVLATLATPTHVLAQQKAVACPPPVHHSQAIFQDLRSVNLYIDIPPQYAQALKCHGREADCSKLASGYGLPSFNVATYIQHLKELYDSYPEALLPDILATKYSQRLKVAYSRLLPRDSACQIPEPIVLNRKNVFQAVENRDTITLTIAVTIVDSTKPKIAILTGSYFRADPGHASYLLFRPFSTAFPLNLPESKIDAIVTDFQNRTVPERPIHDYVQRGSQ